MAVTKRAGSKVLQASASRWETGNSRRRLIAMIVLGAVVTAVSGVLGAWWYAPLVGWDAAVSVFLLMTWAAVGHMSPEATAEHAGREDPTRAQTGLLLIEASLASLVAVGVVLVAAGSAHSTKRALLTGLAVASVGLSWLLVHTLFTLHYAWLYHRAHGGVDFNQQDPPRYLDFAYLAFTIGMTFQVSDTDIKSTAIRASALRHALLSYLFGAVILACTVNFVVSLS
jgi:uncharacterized membrane protein